MWSLSGTQLTLVDQVAGQRFTNVTYGSAAPPLVTPVDPTKNKSGVSSASSINFTLTSDLTIVDPWTVEIDRGGEFELALTYNGAAVFEPLFQGEDSDVSAVAGGYNVTIDPQSPFNPSQSVTVRVTALDNLGQAATVA